MLNPFAICNFSKGYDCISRKAIWRVMEEAGVPDKLVRLTKMCIERTECEVRIHGCTAESFNRYWG